MVKAVISTLMFIALLTLALVGGTFIKLPGYEMDGTCAALIMLGLLKCVELITSFSRWVAKDYYKK